MKKLSILGVTGSIGSQALDVVRQFPDEMKIVCMSAHSDIEGLAAAANEFRPEVLAVTGEADAGRLEGLLCYGPRIISGEGALAAAVTAVQTDQLLLSVLGIAGLPAFAECLRHRIPVALANKESLVCGGEVVRAMMDDTHTQVLPVDSEHSAIFQCLGDSFDTTNVSKIWITASGGPFLRLPKEEIENAPLERALKHPNWAMGKKITIDSASLANKGLEVIEAHFMYRAPAGMIEVVVQPQSLVHSMVEFTDGSVMAQFAPVDMRLPLQKALTYPKMCKFNVNKPLDFKKLGTIEFIEPDMERFPCLALAYEAIESETTAVYNIANEMAVEYYIAGRIRFGGISDMIKKSMDRFSAQRPGDIDSILELDGRVREYIRKEFR